MENDYSAKQELKREKAQEKSMVSKPPQKTADEFVAEVRKHQKEQEKTYRSLALAMYPHICGRCGREFSGKKLRELTVHHRDHNHDNNPSDGSNWELLCIYCHDNEHERNKVADSLLAGPEGDTASKPTLSHNPFAGLSRLIKPVVFVVWSGAKFSS